MFVAAHKTVASIPWAVLVGRPEATQQDGYPAPRLWPSLSAWKQGLLSGINDGIADIYVFSYSAHAQ
jgi:hypothetical protein